MQLKRLANGKTDGRSNAKTMTLTFTQESEFIIWSFNMWICNCTRRLFLFFCLVIPVQPLLAEDVPVIQELPVATEINAVITAKQHPFLTHSDFSNRAEDLDALYKLTNYQLLWLGNTNTEKNIADVLKLLESASVNGLNADAYDIKTLQQKLGGALSLGLDAYKDQALYDSALSLSLLRFLHDLHYGRVNPHLINFNLKLREKKLVDLPSLINASVLDGRISELPAQVEPKINQYQKLKLALADYRLRAEKAVPFELAFQKSIRPGENIPQLAELQRFLVASGDLSDESNNSPRQSTSTRYSDKIVAGIKKFQLRHGLNADGIIGKSTADAINESVKQRVLQIELAMERLRWLPELATGPFIIVNIPAFQLWALNDINDANPEVTNMRVVVGKAMKNQTPVLMAEMRFIDFMPYWNVPYNIVKEEILPKLIQNPGYLGRENMEMVSKSGVVSFNESSIAQLKQGTVRIRQRPGKKNALGKVKFMFPNKEDVYLHDTPANSLFSRSRRDFSHGCVRVANPEGLAEFALKDQWTKETIEKALSNPENKRVILKRTIPVLFFYSTAFFDHENKLVFYPDIYSHDAVLVEALKNPEDVSDQALFVSPPTPEPPVEELMPGPVDTNKPMAEIKTVDGIKSVAVKGAVALEN